MEYIAAYLTMIIVAFVATVACIPPWIQSHQERNKPCEWFSIACFSISLYITIKLIIAMIQYGGN